MNVILLERLKKVGELGDETSVANGFARNYLIPQGKAVRATKANRAEFEAKRQEFEMQAKTLREAAKGRAEQVQELDIVIGLRASQEGRLYGSVGTKEIAAAITEAGVAVVGSEVVLNEGVLRQIGQYKVHLQLHSEIMVSLAIRIEAVTE